MHTNYFYTDNLLSERLQTRFLSKGDIEAWAQFFKDPEAIELFPPSFFPAGQDLSATWIERQLGRYRDLQYGHQALLNRKSGEFIGQCGLLLQEVDGVKELEVGYHVLKKHWGNGYAPEAARMFIDFAFKNKLSDSIISIIDVRNTKSQSVAKKNGLKIDKQTTWRDLDVYIYRIEAKK